MREQAWTVSAKAFSPRPERDATIRGGGRVPLSFQEEAVEAERAGRHLFAGEMKSGQVSEALKQTRGERRALCASPVPWCLGLVLCASLLSCSQKRVEETVTVDASRSSSVASNAQPLAIAPQLPARDADLEQAGDKVAEAIMRLKKRQSAAALTALAQSKGAINRALRTDGRDEDGREALRSTLKGIESAERAIQRGALADATQQLIALNRKVDSIGAQR
ncbi:MAG TPA: hypothetical protein VF544_04665 [Pyrinomonadaceae bacterium]